MQFPSNISFSFTKVRSKKKKDKSGRKIRKGEGGENLRHMSDITLKDTSNFALWEYSVSFVPSRLMVEGIYIFLISLQEENPPIISSVGMGSILVNYYRKRDPTDDFIPNASSFYLHS